MSEGRRLPTQVPAPRAAVVVLAHRRDAAGVPWARAPIADADALETLLGTVVSAGLAPIVVLVGPGDERPVISGAELDFVELDPTADEAAALAAGQRALSGRPGPPPVNVVVAPVEQPLASGTLLWTLVAAREDLEVATAVAASHEGRMGHPQVVRLEHLTTPVPPLLFEAGELALFWTADAPGARDEATRTRARALLATASTRVVRLGAASTELLGSAPTSEPDVLAAEEPLELRLDGEPLAVVMRTPGHDAELATGFLLTEAVVRGYGEIRGLVVRGNVVIVDVGAEVVARGTARRNFTASSSCGVCGKSSIDEVVLGFPPVRSSLVVDRAVLTSLPDRLRAAQAVFSRTGGLHAAAIFDAQGTLRVLREDVGRHNAVDKVVGWAARAGALPLADGILAVSGRIGFEIAQKATAAGLPLIAAVGAPSSLAVDLARRSGVTLVGFLRGDQGNVYTHPDRVR